MTDASTKYKIFLIVITTHKREKEWALPLLSEIAVSSFKIDDSYSI